MSTNVEDVARVQGVMQTSPVPQHAALLAAARSGERTGIDAFTRWIWPQVRRLALVVVGDPTLADDAAQEATLRILRALPSFDASRPFGPWMRTITRNTARNTRNRADPPSADGPDRAAPADLERRLDLDAAASSALRAFMDLPDRQRELIELCDHQGLTPAEAAAELDIHPTTARTGLHAARQALRRALLAERPDLLDLLRTP
jgi:RNA polymerase sigma factor (sigma-70 family)